MEGGALRVGLGCGGDGGAGLTLVSYLRRAGAGVVGTVVAMTAAAAVAVGAAATAAAVSGLGLDPPAGGGEEWHTRGLKLCPPRVLTMPGPEKGRR